MYKLVILIDTTVAPEQLEQLWPEFLHQSELMPGLRRETTSRVDTHLLGAIPYQIMHELIFDTPEQARQAMASEAGRNAGRLLQTMTGGRVTLFLADHKEDDLENIRKYRQAKSSPPTS
ncbi:MAG: hypothetical protein ACOY16_02300 [Chloroflexota bacterium]